MVAAAARQAASRLPAWLLSGFLLVERLRGSLNVCTEAKGCCAAGLARGCQHGEARDLGNLHLPKDVVQEDIARINVDGAGLDYDSSL